MESTDHAERLSFEAYMAQRREREQQLLSRISAALAVLEAQFPEVLRCHTGHADPYEALSELAFMAHDGGVPCEKCTPFFEALLYVERQYVTISQEQDDRLLRLEAKIGTDDEEPDSDYVTLQDAYDALKTAHDTLQLEYQDLETVYHASVRASQHRRED